MEPVIQGQPSAAKRALRARHIRRRNRMKNDKPAIPQRRRRKRPKKDWRNLKKQKKTAGLVGALSPTQIEAELGISFEDGYRKGKYEGGEGILARHVPENMILPEVPVEHVIALGFELVRHLLCPLMGPEAIFIEIQAALHEKRPLSLVRLGDGEVLALAHDSVISSGLARREGPFLGYSGIDIPDHKHRNQLAEAIRHATYVGIPVSRAPNYYGLLLPAFRAYGLHMGQMRMTYSTINYLLAQKGYMLRIMQGRRVLIVGNAASELAVVLQKQGIHVAGIVSPVLGMHDIPRVLNETSQHDFDVALVAAGIPAVILSQRIAQQFGKVAIDFGHLANKLVSGELSLV
ncbi:GT-D fold domain-containing protein [Paenibacillus marinisediminis]